MTEEIYCCGCEQNVVARLTDGKEVYPHRKDLHSLPFWKCDRCKNTVGCHHKTKQRTRPLGNIATPEIKEARQHIHRLLDPLWQSGTFDRKDIYKTISKKLGYDYHTGEIISVSEARAVYKILQHIKKTGEVI